MEVTLGSYHGKGTVTNGDKSNTIEMASLDKFGGVPHFRHSQKRY
jgi:hypothetical protein